MIIKQSLFKVNLFSYSEMAMVMNPLLVHGQLKNGTKNVVNESEIINPLIDNYFQLLYIDSNDVYN